MLYGTCHASRLSHIWYMVVFVRLDILRVPRFADWFCESCVPSEWTVKRRLRLGYTLKQHYKLQLTNNVIHQ